MTEKKTIVEHIRDCKTWGDLQEVGQILLKDGAVESLQKELFDKSITVREEDLLTKDQMERRCKTPRRVSYYLKKDIDDIDLAVVRNMQMIAAICPAMSDDIDTLIEKIKY